MERADLVDALVERVGLTRAQASAVLTTIDQVVVDAVKARTTVRMGRLLTVETVARAARTGRHPRTGEPLEIPAHTAVKVTPGSLLKAAADA